ncbi:MAG: DUF805 domain-containing protein [Pseudomonadota bacterium]
MTIASGPAALSKAVRLTGHLRGRSTRAEFWWVALPLNAVMYGLSYTMVPASPDDTVQSQPLDVAAYLLTLPTLASLHARRFQDVALPAYLALAVTAVFLADFAFVLLSPYGYDPVGEGHYAVLILLAIAGMVSLIVCLLPSQKGANRYGPDPFERQPEDLAEVFE